MTVMVGNQKGKDLFNVNVEFDMPPHTHPKDEPVPILQDKAYVTRGKDATRDGAIEFLSGD